MKILRNMCLIVLLIGTMPCVRGMDADEQHRHDWHVVALAGVGVAAFAGLVAVARHYHHKSS